MEINNVFSPVPFYASKRYWHSNKWYTYGQKCPIIMTAEKTLPFQLVVSPGVTLSSFTIKKADNDTSVMTVNTAGNYFSIDAEAYSIIQVKACAIGTLPYGNYYYALTLSDGSTYISDIIAVISDMSKCIKITYKNVENLYFSSGHIDFTNDFVFELYLPTTIGKPEYEYEEELTKRLGYKFVESQVVNKVYKFTFPATEQLCDAYRFVRMCDYIRIDTYNSDFSDYDHYNVIYLSSEVEWLDNGDIASVETSFETDSIVQKLQDYSRTQLVNFYNALLSNSDEVLKFDDETIAQYYNNYLQSIDGKMIRQLNAVSSISDNTVIAIDENNGTGAANKILLRPLLINTVAEQLRASEVLANFQQHINNSAIHITVAEKAILSLFGVDDNGDVYVKGDKGFYTNSFISAKGKSSSAGGGGSASALYQLVDVLANSTNDGVQGATTNSVLMYNGTKWYAGTIDAGLDEAALKAYLDTNKYTTTTYVDSKLDTKADKTALNAYATLTYVDDELAGTNSAVSTLTEKVNNFLEGTDTDGIINKWKELEAFLAGQTQTSTLADLLNVKAFASTKIIAGTGLTGGGDLTADRTLSLATSGVTAGTYPKVTVDKYGRATAGSSLSASDIPNLSWNKITSDKPTTLSGYGITDGVNSVTVSGSGNAVTAASVSGHVLTLTKGVTFLPQSTFDDLFEKVLLEDGKTYAIRAKYGFYSDSFVSSKGLNSSLSGGGSASALYQLVDVLANSTNDGVLNAANGSVLMYNGTKWQAGNVVTDISPLTLNVNGSSLFTYDGKSSITANLTVPTKVSQLTNDTGFITGINSSMVTNALGYTPYNSTNPNGYISGITKAMVEGVLTGNITSHTHDFKSLTSKPTTIAGYGIADAIYFTDKTNYAAARFATQAIANRAASTYIEWWQSGAGFFNHKAAKYIVDGGTSSQFLKGDGSLDSTAYLPLSGGKLSSNIATNVLTLNSNVANAGTYLCLEYLGSKVAEFGHGYGLDTYMWCNRHVLRITSDGTAYVDSHTLIHSGNIGSQSVNYANSAGNADTVDNEHASAFAHIGAHNNLMASGNEFTFALSGFSGEVLINYRTAGGTNGNITKYTFCNGAGHSLGTAIHTGNYNSYSPTLTGTGASGTWGISITGNAATATNADTVDNLHASDFARSRGSDLLPTDINHLGYGFGHNSWYTYGPAFTFGIDVYYARIQKYYNSNTLYLGGYSTDLGDLGWREFAFTDSNVASATKLQTARTIWGQSFDGAANVSGSLSGVTSITASSAVYTGDMLQICRSGDGSASTEFLRISVSDIAATFNASDSDGFSRMYFQSNGNNYVTFDGYSQRVGIGTTSPSVKLHVIGDIAATGAVTAKASSSDIRLKTDITDYKALSIIRSHKSIKYHWNEVAKANADIFNDDYWHYGLIAQDVQRDMPQMVSDVFKDYLVINYERLIPICWKGLQEVDDEVTKLKKKVRKLEMEIRELKQKEDRL